MLSVVSSQGRFIVEEYTTMHAMVVAARKIRYSLARRGLVGTAQAALNGLVVRVRRFNPVEIHAQRKAARAAMAWDRIHGVDTAGYIPPEALDVAVTGGTLGNGYGAIGPRFDLGAVLRTSKVDPSGTTFIDLGSGKGRAILLAAELPFARIVGVEYSPELHAIAGRNCAAVDGADRIRLICLDATAYEFPPGPLVVYLYNPFGPPILPAVIENLRRSLIDDPRHVTVLYVNPKHAGCWDEAGFTRAASGDDWIAWHGLSLGHRQDDRVGATSGNRDGGDPAGRGG
jgi:SAM-dependent methyltransferase